MTEILTRIDEQTRIEKQEVGLNWRQCRLLVVVVVSSALFSICLLLHAVQVHYILGELCFGGLALETNMAEILTHIDEQNKLEKQEVTDWPTKTNSLYFCPIVHLSYILFSSCIHLKIFLCCFGMFCHVGTSYICLLFICFVQTVTFLISEGHL